MEVKKVYKKIINFKYRELLALLGHVSANPDERDLLMSKFSTVHHDTMYTDEKNIEYSPRIKLPLMWTSHILCKDVSEQSTNKNLKTFMDIYQKWPLGRNRGEDPEGDALMDFVTGYCERYTTTLDVQPLCRKKIFVHIKQPENKDNKTAQHFTVSIMYPTYDNTHPQAGERDWSQSPRLTIKIWTKNLTSDYKPSPNDFLINFGSQKIITKIYDHRDNSYDQKPIHTEEELEDLLYRPGDTKINKPRFELLVQIILCAPTGFWKAEAKGKLQFSAAQIHVMEKREITGNNGVTTEELDELKHEYRTKKLDDVDSEEPLSKRPLLDDAADPKERALKRARLDDDDISG